MYRRWIICNSHPPLPPQKNLLLSTSPVAGSSRVTGHGWAKFTSVVLAACKIRCLLSRGLEEEIGNPTCAYGQFSFIHLGVWFLCRLSVWDLLQSLYQPWSRSPYIKNNRKTKLWKVGTLLMPQWRDINTYPTLWKRNSLLFPSARRETRGNGIPSRRSLSRLK